jgi:hypothetical protein
MRRCRRRSIGPVHGAAFPRIDRDLSRVPGLQPMRRRPCWQAAWPQLLGMSQMLLQPCYTGRRSIFVCNLGQSSFRVAQNRQRDTYAFELNLVDCDCGPAERLRWAGFNCGSSLNGPVSGGCVPAAHLDRPSLLLPWALLSLPLLRALLSLPLSWGLLSPPILSKWPLALLLRMVWAASQNRRP